MTPPPQGACNQSEVNQHMSPDRVLGDMRTCSRAHLDRENGGMSLREVLSTEGNLILPAKISRVSTE